MPIFKSSTKDSFLLLCIGRKVAFCVFVKEQNICLMEGDRVMKQETGKKSRKWLWIALALTALVAVVGVMLAIILAPGQDGDEIAADNAQLYWNIDRQQYIEAETGMSTRTAADGGMYHMRFAFKGEQVDLTVADKQLVNFIDSMDVVGLILGAEGEIIDAVAPDTVATAMAKGAYIQKIEDGCITVNTSRAMNGMSIELPITESTGIYDVTTDAELVGQIGEPQIMDQVIAYADGGGEVTHIYITTHPVNAGIYWRVERCYNADGGVTTRVPDENGVYTIQFAHNGELVDLKCRDINIVNSIDAYAVLVAQFALLFDEEGYIVQYEDVAYALRGKYLAQDYHITAIEGDTYTVTRLSAGTQQGDVQTFTLADDVQIWHCCQFGCYNHNCGQYTDSLRLYDRVNVYTNLDGEANLIFVTRRTVDSPMYYNYNRQYDSTQHTTTRTPVNGYYLFELMVDGKVKTVKVKDKDLANTMDSYESGCMGLELDGNIVTRSYDPGCVFGGNAVGSTITDLIGPVVTITSNSGSSWSGIISPDCKIYNAITSEYGKSIGGEIELQVGDTVTTYRDHKEEIAIIFVTARRITGAKIYYNLDYKYDKTLQTTTREPDGEGYYVFLMACQGKQVTVKTKNKGMTSFIDAQSAPLVGLKVNSQGVITNAYGVSAVLDNATKACNYHHVEGFDKKTGTFRSYYTLNGVKTYSNVPQWKMSKDCVVYNVSKAYDDFRGEVSSLRNGDQIQGIMDLSTGEITMIFVMNRDATFGVKNITGHCDHCGKTVSWTPWKSGVITDDGHYYVHDNITVGTGYIGANGANTNYDVVVDLKGHTLKATGRAFAIYDRLTILDSVGGGRVEGLSPVDGVAANGACVFLYADCKAQLNLYGGTLTLSDRCTQYGGYGSVIMMSKGSEFNMYGGAISDGISTTRAGNVYVNSDAVFNMSGGTISGGVSPAGANVFVATEGKMYMSGGKIDGGIYIFKSDGLTLSGAPVISGTGLELSAGVTVSVKDLTNGASIVLDGDGVFTEKLTNAASYLPYFKAVSDGDIIEADGDVLKYNKKPADYNTVDNSNLVFEADSNNAYCAVCQKTVAWTRLTADAHVNLVGGKHYYLAEDLIYTGAAELKDEDTNNDWFLTANGNGTTTCLHLNGHNVTATQHRVLQGSGGVLNIFGNGTVTGNYSVATNNIHGSTVSINTSGAGGTINLIGGSYVTGNSVHPISIAHNGGRINMYCGATIKGNPDGQSVYIGKATLVNAVFNMFGGTIEDGVVYMTGASNTNGNTATFNLAGGKITGGLTVNSGSTVTVSGAPVVSGKVMELLGGTKLALGALDANASILIKAEDFFTWENDNAEAYKSCFKTADGTEINAVKNALYYGTYVEQKDPLILDENGYGYCSVCQETVQWTAVFGNNKASTTRVGDSKSGHYYLSGDVSLPTDVNNFATAATGKTLCIHLNGKNLTYGSRIAIAYANSTLNILGSGTVTILPYTGNFAGNDACIYVANSGTLNLYGGTYRTTDATRPLLLVSNASGTVNIHDGVELQGNAEITAGMLTLSATAKVDTIDVAADGKLFIKADWTGTAKVDFAVSPVDGKLPESNGACEDTFTGTLTTSDGRAITGEDGRLLLTASSGTVEPDAPQSGFKGVLELDADGYGKCPVCKLNVKWEPVYNGKRVGTNAYGHYYLAEDNINSYSQFATVATDGAALCLHLNGKTLNNAGRLATFAEGIINIMGAGSLIGNGTYLDGADAYTEAALVLRSAGTVNIYGSTVVSTASGKPAVLCLHNRGNVNLYDATVTGGIQMTAGNLTLSGDTVVVGTNGELMGNISVSQTAKLTVKADYAGKASVAFADVTDAIPEANGISEGAYEGKLYLETAAGPEIIGQDGKLIIAADAYNKVLKLDANGYAECPACKETVQWTAVTNGNRIGTNANGHYYLSENVTSAHSQFATINSGDAVLCLHLNGKTLTTAGRIVALGEGTINVMGSGSLIGTSAYNNGTEAYTEAVFSLRSAAILNLYGGSYQSTAEGKPLILSLHNRGTVNLFGISAVGGVNASNGALTLNSTASVDSISVGANAKLTVKADWNGKATVAFASGITDNTVPEANGVSEGDYTGILTTVDGITLIGKDGVLAVELAATA